jgi:hypothetical protein
MDNGTGATASVSMSVYKIIDSSKSWVVNSYAGKYVYLQSATT